MNTKPLHQVILLVAAAPLLAACTGYQMWWHHSDSTVQKYRSTMAALPYGAVLEVGPVRCCMETTGVTCTNWQTGHGIVVSQSTYGMF